MAKIAYILLCHKNPQAIVDQAQQLTAAGDYIAIHFDANAGGKEFQHIRRSLAHNKNVTFAKRRIKCGWGEWSLVQATLNAIEAACAAFPLASHFYMLSGDCMAIKSARYVHQFLDDKDMDYIEIFDFFKSNWIKTGMKEDRLIYRHFFNERARKWLFYQSLEWQRRLGLSRQIPSDIKIQIGSQWWCLRRRTIEAILEFSKARKDISRFFRTTWIPDETYLQTLVGHLIPTAEIEKRPLTFLVFSEYGMPATFYNDHYDFLVAQDFLFARKISSDAKKLKAQLEQLYKSDKTNFPIAADGKELYFFLTQAGRKGQRFAPRIWEKESQIGQSRTLLILVCKKKRVANRLSDLLNTQLGMPTLGYLFEEESKNLPALGGILSNHEKKNRHRRLLLRLLFEHFQCDRMMICLDPSALDTLADLQADAAETRILEIDCLFEDQYLWDYMRRLGLIINPGENHLNDQLLPSIRNQFDQESMALRQTGFENRFVLAQAGRDDDNIGQLMAFCDLDQSEAARIIEQKRIFSD